MREKRQINKITEKKLFLFFVKEKKHYGNAKKCRKKYQSS